MPGLLVRRSRLSAFALFLVAACASAQTAPRADARSAPSLVVMITIDQMRADYFNRFERQLSGGLKRLRTGGAFFINGYQDHAITETAPGHASTLSGRFPVHTGIVMNSQGVNGVPDGQVLGGRPTESASPARFRGTTLTDWMRAVNPATRWLSVSRKDRGAILPLGKNKGNVYWYATNGDFTTSTYYMDSLPPWVRAFNAQHLAHGYAGKSWELLRPVRDYPEPDSVGLEASTAGADIAFPHGLPADGPRAASALQSVPFMDELTLKFALRGVTELGLGSDPNRTDVLAVSLSTTDAIGHRYGPDSREMHDQILRLDQYLDTFLDSLQALRGTGKLLVALTGDHGMTPMPTLRSTIYPNGDAKRVSIDGPWRSFIQRLDQLDIDTTSVVFEEGMVVVTKPGAFGTGARSADALLSGLGTDLMRVQGVLRADLMTDLAKADTVRDAIARRWLHMVPSNSNVRMTVSLTPYSYWLNATYPTHGSPHDSDANVPVLFWGAGVKPGQYSDVVRVVDIAPTLAALLGVKPTEPLDGRVLVPVVR
jgi:predicted AlkP superfamily pyrophosphatase or phosphodiesterase